MNVIMNVSRKCNHTKPCPIPSIKHLIQHIQMPIDAGIIHEDVNVIQNTKGKLLIM